MFRMLPWPFRFYLFAFHILFVLSVYFRVVPWLILGAHGAPYKTTLPTEDKLPLPPGEGWGEGIN